MCIEFQGEQHYKPRKGWNFKLQNKLDNIKRQYCKRNNIILYEIPYTYLEQLDKIIYDLVINNKQWEFKTPKSHKTK